jgi:hypothetical protein
MEKMNSNNKITETHPKNPKTHNKTTQFKPNQKQKTIKPNPNPNPKQTNSIQTKKKIIKKAENKKPTKTN